ncbi:hypothetical protein [uncultured Enterococcus sp.]|uniref:hypothetical protein n=1 Tax=uncultured Enterococcus sp. TaxID=167972 RepID=UPI002AA5E45F|nr:hypothetical protein [uncultured Enterococcus sp.]
MDLKSRKIKIGLIVAAAAVLIFMGVRGLFIFWMREKTVSRIHTDREAIEQYFPDFPETQQLYWVSAVEKRNIGPAKKELYIYAKLDEAEFAHFIEGVSYSEVSRLPLFFQPGEIKGPFDWQKLDAKESLQESQLQSVFQQTVYVDLSKCLVFIEAFNVS